MCGGLPSSRHSPSASAGAGGGKGQHTPQSTGIQVSGGQAATGAVEEGSAGTAGYSEYGQGGLGELAGASGGRDKAGAGRQALGTSKIKISMVLDQADNAEVQPHIPQRFEEHDRGLEDQHERRRGPDRRRGSHWRPVVGACLPHAKWGNTLRRLWGVAAPMGKALFAAFFTCPVSGECIKKEISGPATIGDWNKAWRVFGFAMEVLGAATRTRLKRYSLGPDPTDG